MALGSRTKNRMSKAEQSRQTRQRILEAATKLFLRAGFQSTTVVAIAAEAGVAVQTLYLSFGNKTAILSSAFDIALAGDDEQDALGVRDWYRAIIEDPDGRSAVARFVTNVSANARRAASLYAVLQAASADPEVAEVLDKNKHGRHARYTEIAETLATREGFAPGLTTDDAVAILYTVQSHESYLLMVTEHGWTGQRWEQWVLDTLLHQLFPDGAQM